VTDSEIYFLIHKQEHLERVRHAGRRAETGDVALPQSEDPGGQPAVTERSSLILALARLFNTLLDW
jgi:hypothetical protein